MSWEKFRKRDTTRVYFPYGWQDSTPTGGPAAFAANFHELAHEYGIRLVGSPDEDFDVAFFLVSIDELFLTRQLQRIPILLRLDGLYHDTSLDWESYNRPIWRSFLRADQVIYQSNFSRRFVEKYFGREHPSWGIIPNGASAKLFKPDGPRKELPYKINIITAGNWRPQSRLHYLPDLLRMLGIPGAGLIVAGGFDMPNTTCDPELQARYRRSLEFQDLPVTFLGPISREELAEYFRAADVFLHPTFRDNCPNVVAEAISCGLPVVAERSGGTPELVGDAGIIVPPPEGFTDDLNPIDYQDYRAIPSLDTREFRRGIREILKNRELFRERTRARAAELSATRMVESYAAELHKLSTVAGAVKESARSLVARARSALPRLKGEIFRTDLMWRLQRIFPKSDKLTRIALYGAGSLGRLCLEILNDTPVEVVRVVDSSPEKQGKSLMGYKIGAPSELGKCRIDGVLITSIHSREIEKHLETTLPGKVKIWKAINARID